MEVIKLTKNDIIEALDLIWDVFLEFESPDYSEEGINEFKKYIEYDGVIMRLLKGALSFWGCRDYKNDLAGVIAMRNSSHISLLFVKKEYHRKGIAKKLFEVVKDECRERGNINKITVNSSPYAVEVYHRMGFVDTGIEQTINGIRFVPMNYIIRCQ